MADCWICGSMADKWSHPEARLCPNCWERGLEGLQAINFTFASAGSQIEVVAPAEHAPLIELVFRAETFGSIVKKLVKKELQLGSQQIDDVVYFQEAQESDLPYLQGYEASNLMATLTAYGMVEIKNERALVHLVEGEVDREKAAIFTACLLHFIRHRQNMSHG